MRNITSNAYVKVLENWVRAARKYFYSPAGNPDMMCYGTGESLSWAVQTNMNAFAAFAVLATAPDLDENIIGMNSSELLNASVKMLRYSLRTHHTGDILCSNNKQWGHSWISVLALERMMHGFDAIREFLSEEDKLAMRKILESESSNLLDNYEIKAGIEAMENKPESNIWNGAMLLRAATYYPDTPRKEEYLRKATASFINGISIPSDKDSAEIFNGRTVKEWHIGPNFTKNYSLNHHGYMNVGYMVICMSNIAMLHFSMKSRGIVPPPEVYFHAQELWNAIKPFIFTDGRLLRIGGDSRARYCYCQDYAVPMWLFVLDQYGDEDALLHESGWLQLVMKETAANKDGAFLSTRLEKMARQSPFYYTRLEADRAVSMSYGAYWRHLLALPRQARHTAAPEISWQDEFHGATLVRDPNRIASWVWLAGQRPTGLFIPSDKSNMAEWQHNLSGELITAGIPAPTVVSNEHETFDGGFVSCGCVHWTESRPVGEGEEEDVFARHGIAFAALPDNKTAICLQYAETTRRICIQHIKGLGLKIPNDLFNDFKRKYTSEEGAIELVGCPGREEIVRIKSPWLNIDDCLSAFTVYGDDNFTIYRPAERQIRIQYHPHVSLYADEICSTFSADGNIEPPNKVLIDNGAVLMTRVDTRESKNIYEQQRWGNLSLGTGIRAITAIDANEYKYLLIANFSEKTRNVDISSVAISNKLINMACPVKSIQANELSLHPFTARIFRLA